MRKLKRHQIQIIDKSTGQALDFDFVPAAPVGGKWVRIFQDEVARLLAETPGLRGQSLRVLLYLQTQVGWRNVVPTPAVTAEGLGIGRTNSHRAYAELLKAGFLWKVDGAYYLSPRVGWKGTQAQLEELYRSTPFGLDSGPALAGLQAAVRESPARYGGSP